MIFGLRIRTALSVFVLLSLNVTIANAEGIGGHLEYAHSWADFDGFELEADRFVIGITYDSNLAKDRLFNYRLQVGYQYSDYETGPDANGVSIFNGFGFSFYRNAQVRAFAGPSLRINVDAGGSGGADFVDLSIGGGPMIGLNWHLDDNLSVSGALSYNYLWVGSFCDGCFGDDFENGSDNRVSLNACIMFRTPDDLFRP